MSQLQRFLLLQLLVMSAACTSMHNIKKDGYNPLGGGYYDDEMKTGLHWLQAKSNFAAWPNYDSARKTWKTRAEQLCGNSDYQALRVKESVTEPWSADGLHLVTTREAFVVCRSSGLSIEEARRVLEKLDQASAD